MDLTLADAGSRHTLSIGEEVRVQLPETPTTGYVWTAQLDDDALEVVDDHYDVAETPRGAPGLHTFAFRARRAGPTTLALVQSRAWEQGAVEECRFDFDIQG